MNTFKDTMYPAFRDRLRALGCHTTGTGLDESTKLAGGRIAHAKRVSAINAIYEEMARAGLIRSPLDDSRADEWLVMRMAAPGVAPVECDSEGGSVD